MEPANPEPVSLLAPPADEIRDLLLSLDKAIKAVKMYLPNNPQHQVFLGKAVRKFFDFFRSYPSLRVQIARYELRSGGEVVYHNEDRSSSLAFVLYKDGVREIIFKAGLDDIELKAFIQAFNRDFNKEYLDDDLVTYFWEHNFKYIQYVATEEFLEESLPQEVAAAHDRNQAFLDRGGISRVGAAHLKALLAGAGPGGEPAIPLLQSHLREDLLPLKPDEQERVAGLVKGDASMHYFPFLIEVIINILNTERDQQSVDDLLSLLRRIVELELGKGNLAAATTFLKRIGEISRGTGGMSPEIAARAREVMEYFGEEAFVGGVLAEALSRTEEVNPDRLADFIAALPVNASLRLLDLFARLQSMKVRKAICRGLAILVQNDVSAIYEGLEDTRWYVVRNTITVLGMIRSPETGMYLKKACRHPDVRVRREALKVAVAIESAESDEIILLALDDADEKQRVFCLKNMTLHVGPEIKARIIARLKADSFHKLGDDERRQFYFALARLGAAADLAPLGELLRRKSWMRKELQREQQWAVEALGASGSQPARDLLRSLAPAVSSRLAELMRKALTRTPLHAADGDTAHHDD